MTMPPADCKTIAAPDAGASVETLDRMLRVFSVVTMLMTLPQVVYVWTGRNTEGVSVVSWATYLVSACLWLVYGLRKRDKTIYVPCLGWILLDAAVVIGVLVHGEPARSRATTTRDDDSVLDSTPGCALPCGRVAALYFARSADAWRHSSTCLGWRRGCRRNERRSTALPADATGAANGSLAPSATPANPIDGMRARATAITAAIDANDYAERLERRRVTRAALDRRLLERLVFVAAAA